MGGGVSSRDHRRGTYRSTPLLAYLSWAYFVVPKTIYKFLVNTETGPVR